MSRKKRILFLATIFIIIIFVNIYYKKNITNTTYISFGNFDGQYNITKTNLSHEQIIKEYNNFDYLKLDKIINTKTITYKELKNIISSTRENEFKYGIALLKNKIIILSEEINSNKIINYDDNSINFKNLNNYLKKRNINYNLTNIYSLTIFSTESKFLYNGEFIDLHQVNGFDIRDISVNRIEIDNTIKNSANLLISMNKENGEYIYGMRSYNGKEINSYNILRHAGSTWSLILYYKLNPSENLKITINNAIKYLLDNYIYNYDENTSFVIEKKSNEIKLGGNALTLLMLSEYYEVFNDNKYDDVAKKIANGILYMQEDDGSFYHILNVDGTFKEKFRTVFYDGEAAFALLKFYKISNNQIYFDYAKKTIDMFLKNNYEQYRDQWVSYTMNEFIKYNLDEQYINFTLYNYEYNRNNLDNSIGFGPIRLELLLNTYNSYNYIKNNKPNSEALNKFNLENLENSININLEILFNYYINDEIALYFDKPELVKYGFHDIKDNFRMRIDDIQHSLVGLINYCEHFPNQNKN